MPKEPSYYAILGLQPDADTAAIDAAYRGRSLRFRVGQPRTPRAEPSGPTQEQIEQAYAILGDPESRALYDAVYFPEKQQAPTRRRRVPVWLWAIVGVWIVALLAILIVGLRSRTETDGGAIGRIAGQTATVVAAGSGGGSATSGPSGGVLPDGSPTNAASLPGSSATKTSSGAVVTQAIPSTATSAAVPTATVGPTQTTAPTATRQPTNTATLPPPTATAPPTSTSVPPTPVPPTEPPPTEPPPVAAPEPPSEPEPTATPSFRPTDRIGTAQSVNLRSGPGVNYPSLGLLPTGTLLRATGETATVGGQLWRRFVVEDGRVGWIRDLDVFSTH